MSPRAAPDPLDWPPPGHHHRPLALADRAAVLTKEELESRRGIVAFDTSRASLEVRCGSCAKASPDFELALRASTLAALRTVAAGGNGSAEAEAEAEVVCRFRGWTADLEAMSPTGDLFVRIGATPGPRIARDSMSDRPTAFCLHVPEVPADDDKVARMVIEHAPRGRDRTPAFGDQPWAAARSLLDEAPVLHILNRSSAQRFVQLLKGLPAGEDVRLHRTTKGLEIPKKKGDGGIVFRPSPSVVAFLELLPAAVGGPWWGSASSVGGVWVIGRPSAGGRWDLGIGIAPQWGMVTLAVVIPADPEHPFRAPEAESTGGWSFATLWPAIQRNQVRDVADLLRDRPETERRAIAPDVRAASELRNTGFRHDPQVFRAPTALNAAVLGTLTPAELDGDEWSIRYGSVENAAMVVDRNPPFVEQLVTRVLEEGWTDWDFVRHLMAAGVCERPEVPQYADLLLATATQQAAMGMDVGGWLRAQDGVLDIELWRIFETTWGHLVETDLVGPLVAMATRSNRSGGRGAHQGALFDHQNGSEGDAGDIDRDRLIAAAAFGASRDVRPKQVRWYETLLVQLKPTVDEVRAHQDELVRLLTASGASTRGVAASLLRSLDAPSMTDPAGVVRGLASAVTASTKKAALEALAVLAVAGQVPEVRRDAADAAFEAFDHKNGDVRRRAVETAAALVADLSEAERSRLGSALEEAIERLPVGEQAAARASLVVEPESPTEADAGSAADERGVSIDIDGIPADVRARLHLDEARAAVDDPTTRVPNVDRTPPDHVTLSDADRVTAVTDVDELADLLSRGMADALDPIEIDLLLDGVARMGPDASVLGRRLPILEKDSARHRNASWPAQPGVMFANLLDLWQAGPSPYRDPPLRSILYLLDHRAAEVSRWLEPASAGPQLSLPTHRGGWIEPRVFAERVVQAEAAGRPLRPGDLIAALLRLHGLGGDEALAALPADGSRVVALARHALGGEPTGAPSEPDAPYLIADHVRQRRADPGAVDRAAADAVAHLHEVAERYQGYLIGHSPTPPPPPATGAAWLADIQMVWDPPRAWLAIAAPADQELVFVPHLGLFIAGPGMQFANLLEVVDGSSTLGPTFGWTLAWGLSSGDGGVRLAAVDLLDALAAGGRLDGGELGERVAYTLGQPQGMANRVGATLTEAVRVSPLVADGVVDVMTATFRVLGESGLKLTGVHALTEVLAEALARSGRALEPDKRVVIEPLAAGSSKRARGARSALAAEPNPTFRRTVAIARLEGRLAEARGLPRPA